MTANRSIPDSTNASLPYDSPAWQRDANDEVKAIWKRVVERPSAIAGTNSVTGTAAAADVAVMAAYGPVLIVRPANTNTGPVTINVDSIGAVDVLDSDGNALAAGEFAAGRDHALVWDGAAYRIVANGSAPPPTVAQPGPVLIDTQTAASSSALAFVIGFDDTYDRYELEICSLKPANDEVRVMLRVGTGAGPTWQTGASAYAWHLTYGWQASMASTYTGGDSAIMLVPNTAGLLLGNEAGENFSARIHFNNPEATNFCEIRLDGAYSGTGTTPVATWGGGRYVTAGAITGLQLSLSSGNIASGVGRLRGWPKT